MDLMDKEVLVIGLGISGVSTIKALDKLGARISVSDSKSEEELKDILGELKDIKIKKYLNDIDFSLSDIDLLVKSPGVPPTAKIVKKAIEANIEIITDIELGYRLSPTDNIIAITGTNGKTTTTILTGEIFEDDLYNTFVVGNIGIGILKELEKAKKDDVFIIEASSFQLENTSQFKPKVSLILNISPDHLDWHGSYENYIRAKKKIFKNQNKNDYTVLNYDDKILRSFEGELNSNIIWFSSKEKLDSGIYIEEDFIVIKNSRYKKKIMPISDIKILGKHNLENILASIAIAYAMDLDLGKVRETIKTFPGVEHRLEYVTNKGEVSFYNDSKGTNIEASIKAIESIEESIILIAGGYDKGLEFDELIKVFNSKVKKLILLGETKEKLKDAAIRNNFNDYVLVKDLEEAVKLAYSLSSKGDSVLLSPACASWGMYKNFEERGKAFKKLVSDLEEE